MASREKTRLGFNVWHGKDKPKMDDFNADNKLIDILLSEIDGGRFDRTEEDLILNKLQIKRGLKSNLPTLGVGEFGMCTDTNELFVGNHTGNIQIATDAYVGAVNLNKAPLNSILINSINPNQIINQRARHSYSAINQYTIDRWKLISGTLTVNVGSGSVEKPESIILNGTVRQIIEFPQSYAGKTVTASATEATVSINGSKFEEEVTVKLPSPLPSFYMDVKGENSNPSQVQLVFGNMVQPFNPRPFGEELALCQRYYEPIKLPSDMFLPVSRMNFAGAQLILYVTYKFTTSKRIVPTIIVDGLFRLLGYGANGSVLTVDPHATFRTAGNTTVDMSSIQFNASVASLATGTITAVIDTYTSNPGKIAFDAEM